MLSVRWVLTDCHRDVISPSSTVFSAKCSRACTRGPMSQRACMLEFPTTRGSSIGEYIMRVYCTGAVSSAVWRSHQIAERGDNSGKRPLRILVDTSRSSCCSQTDLWSTFLTHTHTVTPVSIPDHRCLPGYWSPSPPCLPLTSKGLSALSVSTWIIVRQSLSGSKTKRNRQNSTQLPPLSVPGVEVVSQ